MIANIVLTKRDEEAKESQDSVGKSQDGTEEGCEDMYTPAKFGRER